MSVVSSAAPAGYVANVQILRFFAALLVVCGHASAEIAKVLGHPDPDHAFVFLDWGLGVDVFFVISGFIMYFLMSGRFGVAGAPAAFLTRRLLRIAPLYWFFTTLTLAAAVFASSHVNNSEIGPVYALASYLFVPWPRADGQIFPILSLGWTLNYEIMFYGVFAVALFFRRSVGLVLMLAVFAAMIITARLAPEGSWLIRFWGDPIIVEFLLGVGIAAAYLSGFRMSPLLGVVLIAIGLTLALASYQTALYEHVWRLFTGGVPASLIMAGVVLGLPQFGGRIAGALALGGDASYSLYLSHPFVLRIGSGSGLFGKLQPVLGFVIGVAMCVGVSIAVFYVVEKGLFASRRPKERGRRAAVL